MSYPGGGFPGGFYPGGAEGVDWQPGGASVQFSENTHSRDVIIPFGLPEPKPKRKPLETDSRRALPMAYVRLATYAGAPEGEER